MNLSWNTNVKQFLHSIRKAGRSGGVEWCFHMAMVCSRAAQLHFEGGGEDGNEKEMTQSCGRMSSKNISMHSSSEHGRFGHASHTSERWAASPPGKGSWQPELLCLAAPQVTGSSSSWGSILVHRLFFSDGLTCLNIFYKYMEKWGFFLLLYPLFCFTLGICIVTIIINALVLGPDAENFVFNSIWFYRRGSILWEDKRKFSWCYRQWERRKSAQGLSSACQYGCSATRKHIQGFFLVWMLKQHKVANTIVFIVEYV